VCRRSSAFRVATLLLISVGVASCGSAGGRDRKGEPRSLSLANAKGKLAVNTRPELGELILYPKGPTLARVSLPGDETISIAAVRCSTSRPNCYEFAEYWEEPARYVYLRTRHGRKRGMVKRFAGTGPSISEAGPAERMILDMVVSHDCAGPPPYRYPYAFAYGLLRGAKDVVSDRVNGKTITMKTAAIPARMHPEGLLMYGLLRPGPNDIVVRTPSGRVVSRMSWAGSDKETSCRS